MIIQLIESIEITATDGITKHWFLEQQQFSYLTTLMVDTTRYYVIEYIDKQYRIPEYAVALLRNETPSTDMRGPDERLSDYINRDPIPDIYPDKDIVKAAKELLGVDIAAKKGIDQADYDGRRNYLLKNHPNYQNQETVKVGINVQGQT